MSKYLIYSNSTGAIWRELDQYIVEEDGTIFGGLNGVNTLRYPPAVAPAVLEITNEQFAEIVDKLNECSIKNGELVLPAPPVPETQVNVEEPEVIEEEELVEEDEVVEEDEPIEEDEVVEE